MYFELVFLNLGFLKGIVKGNLVNVENLYQRKSGLFLVFVGREQGVKYIFDTIIVGVIGGVLDLVRLGQLTL